METSRALLSLVSRALLLGSYGEDFSRALADFALSFLFLLLLAFRSPSFTTTHITYYPNSQGRLRLEGGSRQELHRLALEGPLQERRLRGSSLS